MKARRPQRVDLPRFRTCPWFGLDIRSQRASRLVGAHRRKRSHRFLSAVLEARTRASSLTPAVPYSEGFGRALSRASHGVQTILAVRSSVHGQSYQEGSPKPRRVLEGIPDFEVQQNRAVVRTDPSNSAVLFGASCRIRTDDPRFTRAVLWPTELRRHAPRLPDGSGTRRAALDKVSPRTPRW